MKAENRIAVGLVIGASVAFALGLTWPMFTVRPSAGEWTALVQVFPGNMMRPQTVSLFDGLWVLWREGEVFLAVLLALLSLILPVLKLCVIWLNALSIDWFDARILRFFRTISKYAMAEVFVLALLVVVLKSLPGDSHVTLHAGAWAYTGSVILSIAAGVIAHDVPERKSIDH